MIPKKHQHISPAGAEVRLFFIVDPDIRNLGGIKCYEKLGFKEHRVINTMDAIQRSVQLRLMMLNRKVWRH